MTRGQFNTTPYVGHAMLAQAIAMIGNELPNALVVVASDGGRSANGGDQAGFPLILAGPKSLVNNLVAGPQPNIQQLGNPNFVSETNISMSDGSKRNNLEHRHIFSLVAKLSHNINTGVPYPVAIDGKKLSPIIA